MESKYLTIIGGGIAGLYCALNLAKIYPGEIQLLEKYSIGGRIYTSDLEYTDPKTDKSFKTKYEAGATRFNDSHHLLIDLLNEFKLKNKMIPIKSDYENKTLNGKTWLNYLVDAYDKSKTMSQDYLISHTLEQFLFHLYTPDEVRFIIDEFGYNGEFEKCNSKDAFDLFKKENFYQTQFYTLDGGLSQLIEKMKEEIQRRKCKIHENVNVVKIEKVGKSYQIFTFDNQMITSNKVIIAIQPKDALNIDFINKNYGKIINTINQVPLCRVYAIFPGDSDFVKRVLNNTVFTTSFPIRMIIPAKPNDNFVQISYSDSKYAIYWYESYRSGFIKKNLKKQLEMMFPNEKVPEPNEVKVEFWLEGVNFWGINVKSKDFYNFLSNSNTNLYFANEGYSLRQGWMEGSLEMAENVCKKVTMKQ